MSSDHAFSANKIFITLFVLTAIEVAWSLVFHDSPAWFKWGGLLIFAFWKGLLIYTYFMHMKFEGKLIYLILIVPVGLCVLLIFALLPDVTFGNIFHDFIANAWRHAKH